MIDCEVLVNFYHHKKRLVSVLDTGYALFTKKSLNGIGFRVEVFDIADDEQLIGCKLENCSNRVWDKHYFGSVTWIKMKVMFS